MHQIARYSLNKLIVLWTVLLLFTPCTAKQSLKGFLGLPVSTLNTAGQANKLRNCPETRQASENQSTAYSSAKQFKDLLPGDPIAFLATYKETVTVKLPDITNRRQAYTVPIYILHERLLI
ncbi:MAG: hypothetical protein JNM21_01910 [Taibaiella sp.]|nr:hypothetical protein [Taibaiella sp.]